MSDEQTLLAVIAVIYLADCVYWIPRNGLSFTRWIGKFWNPRSASNVIGNTSGGLGLANPLPPLGVATRACGWTISISAQGLSSAFAVEWAEVKSIAREEKRIFVNDRHFATAPTEYSARRMARELGRLHKLSDKKRSAEIEKSIAETCDPAKIRKRLEEFFAHSSTLRYVGNLLFVFLFGACPFLVWRRGMEIAIWPMVIGIYIETIIIGLLFSKAHRQIYPEDSGLIFKPFITMLLAAPSAIRAQDILGRPLLEEFHPLAAAKTLCREAEFETLAATVVRDLLFPPGVRAHAIDLGFRELLRRALEQKLSLDVGKYSKAPERSETVNVQYCPRCLQQFTERAVNCADCGGRALVILK